MVVKLLLQLSQQHVILKRVDEYLAHKLIAVLLLTLINKSQTSAHLWGQLEGAEVATKQLVVALKLLEIALQYLTKLLLQTL